MVAGCVGAPATSEDVAGLTTVGDYVGGSCSTAVVIGLATQISDEVGCEHPSTLVPFDASSHIVITSNAVLQYLESDAKADLLAVAQSHTLEINSAYRTIAQQYLLYHWYLQGRCGITAAATPGTSNHESGRAVDLANYSDEISAMAAHGWEHDVPGDVVHFDHVASADNRTLDVHAFQVLWNRNHPSDLIAEDGDYGPQTEARLVASPSTGFANGPSCTSSHASVANVVSIDGPDRVPPSTQVMYSVVLANGGDTTWPASTQVALAGGATSSPLHDPAWASPTVVATLGSDVAPGDQATLAIAVTTPAATADTAYTLPLALDDGTAAFASFSLSLTVAPDDKQPTSGDGSDETGYLTGGCSAGSGGGWLAAIAFATLVTAGRTRRRPR